VQTVKVTKELGEKIKELRLINKVKAIEVAEHIEKSSAYVSKLENGDIKTIDYDEFLKIFNFISKSPEDLEKFIDRFSLELTPAQQDERTWLLNFDTVERRIPVPDGLVDHLNKKMCDLGINASYLVEYVNKNEDIQDVIDKYNIDINKYRTNYWYDYDIDRDTKIVKSFIVMKLKLSNIIDILDKKSRKSNYVTIKSLLYNLLRLEYGSENPITDEKNVEIKNETTNILNTYKFYDSREKNRLLNATATQQERDALLDEFDIENRRLINELLKYLSFLSNWDVDYTNKKVIQLNKNFKWDPGYILALASLPYFELETISKSLKSNLLEDIKKLIEEYKNKPESEKKIEVY